MHYALLSGLFGALGSLFGKLVGIPMLEGLWMVRILCFMLMLTSNICVWTFYVKALHSSDSSLSATVSSTASNYIFSALCGVIFFEESANFAWCIGFLLIISGLCLIIQADEKRKIRRRHSRS